MNPVFGMEPATPVSPDILPLSRTLGQIIIHVDMDSFYASVEVQRRPELAGKPLVIGANPKEGRGRGVVSTCSYEARKFGVRSAMPISQAYLLCPDAVYLPPDFPAYLRASAAVMAILRSYGYRMEQVSIDEAYLDLSPLENFSHARALATEIQNTIRQRLGLSCSVGIAPTRSVAKRASDFQKPGGITVVSPPSLPGFLHPLPVRKIPGIGRKAEQLFFEMGIRTIGDLACHDIQDLIGRFGRNAVFLQQIAQGADGRGVVAEEQDAKSLSRETTFDADTDDMSIIGTKLEEQIVELCTELAERQLRFRILTLKIRYSGFFTRSRSRSLPHSTREPALIRNLVRTLFCELYDGRKIRLVGVRFSSFEKRQQGQVTLPV